MQSWYFLTASLFYFIQFIVSLLSMQYKGIMPNPDVTFMTTDDPYKREKINIGFLINMYYLKING